MLEYECTLDFAVNVRLRTRRDNYITAQNEWYPRGIQISLHIRSPGFQTRVAGVLCQVKTESAKICLDFNFGGGGGGTLSQVKTQSAKICLNFNFHGGGGYSTVLRVGHSQNFEPNFQPLQLASASQIVSHILKRRGARTG